MVIQWADILKNADILQKKEQLSIPFSKCKLNEYLDKIFVKRIYTVINRIKFNIDTITKTFVC